MPSETVGLPARPGSRVIVSICSAERPQISGSYIGYAMAGIAWNSPGWIACTR